jgi:DNA-binding transcriptional MocR family regulator
MQLAVHLLQYILNLVLERYQSWGRSAREIAAAAERAIRDGSLPAGERLPTVRGLAGQLGVSPATVAGAYRTLGDRGLVVTGGRAGTRVAPRPPLPASLASADVPPGVHDVRTGLPDPRLLPPLAGVMGRVADGPQPNRFGAHNDALLVQRAADGFTADGVPARRVAVVSGALDGVERALQTRLATGDRVAIEDPGYPPVADLVRALGLRPVAVRVDDDGPRPDDLDAALGQGARAAIVTPRAQNPTGAAVSAGRARDLRAVLRSADVLVVEDDHAGPVAGAPYVPVGPRAGDSWVTIRSVSKSLHSDLRLAVVAGDAVTIDRLEGRQSLGAGWVSTILQRTVAALWSDDGTKILLARAEAAYRERRDALIAALAERGLVAHGRSGLNVWVPVEQEGATAQALLAAGWATAPGERFRLRTGPGIRVTVSGLDIDACGALADAFAAAVRTGGSGY